MRVLVTGGTSGIGRAVVARLSSDGERVAFIGRDEARGTCTAAETGARFIAADVRDSAAVARGISKASALLGGLDGIVLGAGVVHDAPISRTPDSVWDAVIDTNLLGTFRCAVAGLPELRATRGSLVIISSGVGIWPEATLGAYSVSKRALISLTQMLAVEAAPDGVRVNAICPGDARTGMAARVEPRAGDSRDAPVSPLGGPATPDEIVPAVMFLLSPGSAHCNGAAFLVDGGARASSSVVGAP